MNNLDKKSLDYAINVHKNTPNVDASIIYATSLDFKSGVEFAQRWLSVKSELPNNDELCLVKFDLDESKLIGGFKTGNIYVSYFCDRGWVIEEQGGGLIVTEWRRITVS